MDRLIHSLADDQQSWILHSGAILKTSLAPSQHHTNISYPILTWWLLVVFHVINYM